MTTPLAGRGIQEVIGDYHYSLILAMTQIYQRLNIPSHVPGFKYNAAHPPSPSNRFIMTGTPPSAASLKGLSVAECFENLATIRAHIGRLLTGFEVDVEANNQWIYPEDWPGYEGPGSVSLVLFRCPRYVRAVRPGSNYEYYEENEFAEACGIPDLRGVDGCKWNARGGRDWSDTAILLAHLVEFEIWPQFYVDNLQTQKAEGRDPDYDPDLNEWDTGPLYVGRGTMTLRGTYSWSEPPGRISAANIAGMSDKLAAGWEAFVAQTATFYPDVWGYGSEYEGGVGVMGGWADGQTRYPPEVAGYWIFYHWIYTRFGTESVPPYIMYETGVYASAIRALEWPVRYSIRNLKSGSNVTFIFGDDRIDVPDGLRGKFKDFVPVDPFQPVEPELTCEIPENSPFKWEYPSDFYVVDANGDTVSPLEPVIANANWAWAWPNHEGPRYIATLDPNSYIPA